MVVACACLGVSNCDLNAPPLQYKLYQLSIYHYYLCQRVPSLSYHSYLREHCMWAMSVLAMLNVPYKRAGAYGEFLLAAFEKRRLDRNIAFF